MTRLLTSQRFYDVTLINPDMNGLYNKDFASCKPKGLVPQGAIQAGQHGNIMLNVFSKSAIYTRSQFNNAK